MSTPLERYMHYAGLDAFFADLPLMTALGNETSIIALGMAIEERLTKLHSVKRTPQIQTEIDELKGHVEQLLIAHKMAAKERIAAEAKTHVVNVTKVHYYGKGLRAQVSIKCGGKSYTRHLRLEKEGWRGKAVFSDAMMVYQLPIAA